VEVAELAGAPSELNPAKLRLTMKERFCSRRSSSKIAKNGEIFSPFIRMMLKMEQ